MTSPGDDVREVDGVLEAPYTLEYTYTRSTGTVLGTFLGGLKARRMLGIRTAGGRVLCPPKEYDPTNGEATADFVALPATGTVTTWAWVTSPRPEHPLDRPFAWALVKIDGADTALLHVVDAVDPRRMAIGMRVRVRWAEDREGSIKDIACFEPEAPA